MILFILGRDSNNDRWNDDNQRQDQRNSNFNNFRNNNRNINNKGNMNNMNNMNNSNSGNLGSMSNSGNTQTFGFSSDKPKTVLNGGVMHGYASAREIRARHPNANDCEIVVLEKHLV